MDHRDDEDSPGQPDSAEPTSADGSTESRGESIPAIQRLYENIWLWAVLAIAFWAVSYLVWGYVELTLLEVR